MSNVAFVLVDDQGPFIRQGTIKYRPRCAQDIGNVKKGATVKAWPVNSTKSEYKVLTPGGQKIWPKAT